MANITGIDVSKHQGNVDWKKVVKDPLAPKFVYMRGTIGADSVDSKYQIYYPQAVDSGLKVGMYHLIWPKDNFKEEVNDILEEMTTKHWDLPLALDVEQGHGMSKAKLREYIISLCQGLIAEGIKPIIYTGPGFWNGYVGSDPFFKDIDLWNAHYTSAAKPLIPTQWSTWKIWQYTSEYRIQGVTTNTIDCNRFNGTEADFEAWLNSYKKKGHPYADNSVGDLLGS